MPDDAFEERIRPIIDERLRRTRRAKRELQDMMSRLAIPWIAVGGILLYLSWPVGLVMVTSWIGVQAAIAFLDIYPYTIFSSRSILLAIAALLLPIAVLVARLGDIVDLLCTLWLTGWVIFIAIEMHKAILRRKEQ